ncbi:MAG TPA: hypothetical protein VMS89_02360 [Methanoregulaceae archaeon]|nr:hypothetical protein [Methanoregulaceae archaeon]
MIIAWCGESQNPYAHHENCPQCGEEVEIFSNDIKVRCSNCGFVIYNDIISCVQWCKYAKKCVREEMYFSRNFNH